MPRRSIDHVVMPVETLGSIRALLEALGFVVAPEARHPFGTGNCCVFLADGTYVEPLAVLDRNLAEDEAAAGNAFLRHDLSYRLRHPLPGFSGVALASDDAAADATAFADAGFGGADLLEFGRPFDRPDGSKVDLRFRLAFAAERAAPETFVFSCQRLFDRVPDRSTTTAHPNGVFALRHLVYAAAEPDFARSYLGRLLGEVTVANSLGLSIEANNAVVDLLSADGLAARFGTIGNAAAGLRLVGLVFATTNLDAVRARVAEAALPANEVLGRVVVPLSQSGEVFLAFEAAPRR